MISLSLLSALLACRPDATQADSLQEAMVASDAGVLDAALKVLPESSTGGPSVVLIVLDTTRADHLAAYGETRGLMPTLDAFSEQSRVYTQMQSVAGWTLPAHASLFTGLLPIEHGAHGSPPGSSDRGLALGSGPDTLAERLVQAGYSSVGLVANRGFLDRQWGLDRGFQAWLCEELGQVSGQAYVQGNRIAALTEQLMEHRGSEGLFLFLNLMDAHTPWIPRRGYVQRPRDLRLETLPVGLEWEGDKHDFAQISREVNGGQRQASEREQASWREAYASELRYMDAQLARIFAALEAGGHSFESDYTVILADHGEFLGEHRLVEHSKALYSPVTRVPLLVRGPGFEPGVDAQPIQTSDVADLLLAALGVPLLGDGAPPGELMVSEMYWSRLKVRRFADQRARFNHLQRSYTLDRKRLYLRDDGVHEAYDLRLDPGELDNVYETAPWVPELESAAFAWLASMTPGAQTPVGQGSDEALRALGYIE